MIEQLGLHMIKLLSSRTAAGDMTLSDFYMYTKTFWINMDPTSSLFSIFRASRYEQTKRCNVQTRVNNALSVHSWNGLFVRPGQPHAQTREAAMVLPTELAKSRCDRSSQIQGSRLKMMIAWLTSEDQRPIDRAMSSSIMLFGRPHVQAWRHCIAQKSN